jgi:hypothetical protein
MPNRPGYESHLSSHAAAFIISLSKRRQRIVLDLADQIARQPFAIGDYQTLDATGRSIDNVLLENYLFTYWVDHASREVRIAEISRV